MFVQPTIENWRSHAPSGQRDGAVKRLSMRSTLMRQCDRKLFDKKLYQIRFKISIEIAKLGGKDPNALWPDKKVFEKKPVLTIFAYLLFQFIQACQEFPKVDPFE